MLYIQVVHGPNLKATKDSGPLSEHGQFHTPWAPNSQHSAGWRSYARAYGVSNSFGPFFEKSYETWGQLPRDVFVQMATDRIPHPLFEAGGPKGGPVPPKPPARQKRAHSLAQSDASSEVVEIPNPSKRLALGPSSSGSGSCGPEVDVLSRVKAIQDKAAGDRTSQEQAFLDSMRRLVASCDEPGNKT